MSPIGTPLVRLDAVDSTNAYASRQLALGNAGHGMVITAARQRAGRGQRGREWHDSPGKDHLMSAVLLPERMPAMAQFDLAKAAALAVVDTLGEVFRASGKDTSGIRVKWPNDVLVDGLKVSGTLIANEIKGDRVASAIVGIGINVNGTDLDGELKATGLCIETGMQQDVSALLERLCAHLQKWWDRIGDHEGTIASAYLDLLWTRDRFTGFILDDRPFTARPLDVDGQGRLIVEDEAGRVAAYGLDRLRHMRR
jgi:BirA family biotin operon repressor/biotin-[acetyl-CoA-carboxylase] ligase